MFTAYIKYISLLLFSGLILTFYRAAAPTHISIKSFKAIGALKADERKTSFSVLNDVILPFFPVLNIGEPIFRNKK